MLRVDVNGDDFADDPAQNYAIPPGNPFRNRPGARPEIWAFGLRNPWRNSFDRDTGDLYIGDVGQDRLGRGELPARQQPRRRELRLATKEGTERPVPGIPDDQNIRSRPGSSTRSTSTPPAPAHAVIGGYVYRGAAIPTFQGTYLFADHFTNIWSFRYDGTAKS